MNNKVFDGVNVVTSSVDLDPDPPEVSEYEYQLITVFIWMTLDVRQPIGTIVGVDVNAAASALESYGYSEYESRPMVWETLSEIDRRIVSKDL